MSNLDASFAALADPTRRGILARLALGEATVNELVEPFEMTQQPVSKTWIGAVCWWANVQEASDHCRRDGGAFLETVGGNRARKIGRSVKGHHSDRR